jgi:two-component system response regulator FlrC
MHILIVGSLSGALGTAARMAVGRGARLDQADTVEDGLAQLRSPAPIDAVLCDIALDLQGLVMALAEERIAVPVIACGVSVTPERAAQAIRDGAREFLPLPPDSDLIAAILEAISGDMHRMVARDPAMLALLRRADQVASADASILITGESGTGKEVLARHLHRRSRRAAGPFVALNCATIPDNLLESELFGHEKGAFSGAVARRIGRFEAANGGTLLLDEISEMDPRLQAKLLRALQEREIDRLGGSGPVRVDVRILATSNRDLLAEVARGNFREDLYFRLNVVSLRIPPLRERPGDIAALSEHFARRYAEANGVAYRAVSAAALGKLIAAPWRGNVRELENTLHRAVLLAQGDETGGEIAPENIELLGAGPQAASMREASPIQGNSGLSGLVGRRMEEVERDLIIETLHHTLGNRTHAATILGISIRALRNKLRDYAAQGAQVPPPSAGALA